MRPFGSSRKSASGNMSSIASGKTAWMRAGSMASITQYLAMIVRMRHRERPHQTDLGGPQSRQAHALAADGRAMKVPDVSNECAKGNRAP